MPTPHRKLRVDDEQWQEWQAAAVVAGLDLSAFIRRSVNEAIARGAPLEQTGPGFPPVSATLTVTGASPGIEVVAPPGTKVVDARPDLPVAPAVKALQDVEVAVDGKPVKGGTVRKRGPRKELCLHRVPPESYCRRCDG